MIRALVFLAGFSVASLPGTAWATPILELPGFVGVQACTVDHPGATVCYGATRDDFLAHPGSLFEVASPGIGASLFVGLGDSIGDLGGGDEFFVLHIGGGPGDRFLLDYVALQFVNPVRVEYASAITATAGLTFEPGFGPDDLDHVLGPPDGQRHVGLASGTLFFAFPSSLPTAIPEPPTSVLFGAGLVGIIILMMRSSAVRRSDKADLIL